MANQGGTDFKDALNRNAQGKGAKQVPPCGMQDSPSDAHWGFKEGPGQLSYRTATSKTLVLLSPENILG